MFARRKSKTSARIEQFETRRLLSTIYVSAAAPGITQDGISWATAYTSLQSALAVAISGTTIEVGQGTYKPTTGTDRTATFQLKTGVAIYGGYAGYGASNPNVRDVVAFPTVLSADIGTPIAPSDNSYHVISAAGVDATAILSGFTVTAGYANGSTTAESCGGAIYDSSSSPTLDSCTFTGNTATGRAGVPFTTSTRRPLW